MICLSLFIHLVLIRLIHPVQSLKMYFAQTNNAINGKPNGTTQDQGAAE